MTNEELFKSGLEEINELIDENQAMIELGKKAQKLVDSKEWQEVIEEGYFDAEATRLKDSILNINNMMKKDTVDTLVENLKAIRAFKQFITYKIDDAKVAESNIDGLRENKRKWIEGYEESLKQGMEAEEVIEAVALEDDSVV